jgi:D-tyrosyl-tRNA(Tyr) deacylase
MVAAGTVRRNAIGGTDPMRLVIQRVTRAAVRIDGKVHAEIGRGLLILAGIHKPDTEAAVDALAARVASFRCFEDDQGKMNRSAPEAGAEFLVVSQFTLCADLARGRRPGFDAAMPPEPARALVDRFADGLARASGRPVRTGVFGATMAVELVNDGPVTFVMDSPPASSPGVTTS